MKVRGQRGYLTFNYVECRVICQDPKVDAPVTFAIDTACNKTGIADKDALVLNLDYSKLERSKTGVKGIGGHSRAYYLKNVAIVFPSSEPVNHTVNLDFILVHRHVIRNEKHKQQVHSVPSLLGLDVLRLARITHDNDGATIEWPPFDTTT